MSFLNLMAVENLGTLRVEDRANLIVFEVFFFELEEIS